MKKINWKKWLPIVGGSFVILLVLAYFVITSSFFLTSVALPVAGKCLDMEIKADKVKLSGLSKIAVSNLSVTPNNEETILAAGEVMAELGELDLSFASFDIKEVYLDKGLINIVQTPTGGNLAAILKLFSGETDTNKPPMKLAIDKVTGKDTTIKWKMIGEDNSVMGSDLSNVQLVCAGLGTEKTGTVSLSCGLGFYMGSSTNLVLAPENVLQGPLTAELKVPLTKEMMPGIIEGPMGWTFAEATGMFAPFGGYNVGLDLGLSLEEIQKLVLDYRKDADSLLKVAVNGTMDLSTLGANLKYELSNLDSRLINVFSVPMGMKFDKTFIHSKGELVVADSLSNYSVQALSSIKDVILVTETPTPIVSVESDVNLSANLNDQTLKVTRLFAKGLQGEDKEFLSVSSSEPVVIGWGVNTPKDSADSSLTGKVSLDMADWRNFLQDANAEGQVNGDFALSVKEHGTHIELDGNILLSALKMMGIQASGKISTQNALVRAEESNGIKGNFGVENFSAAMNGMSVSNFAANSQYDVTLSNDGVIDIPSVQVAFAPTSLAKNILTLNGKLDMRATNATPSSLNLMSEGVDVSPVIAWVKDYMANKPEASVPVETAPEKSEEAETGKAQPIELPFKDLVAKVAIDTIFADTLQITNFVHTLSIKGEAVNFVAGPVQLVAKDSVGTIGANIDFNLKSWEGKVHYAVKGIDENILNPLAAIAGVEIADVAIQSEGDVSIADNLNAITLKTVSEVSDFRLAGKEEIPPVSLNSDVDGSVNLKNEVVRLEKMDATGLLGEKKFLTTSLDKSLVFAWGNNAPENVSDSSLTVLLDLDAADWKALLKDDELAGKVVGTLNLSLADAGNKLAVNGDLALDNVRAMGNSLLGKITTDATLARSNNGNDNAFTGNLKIDELTVENEALSIQKFMVGMDYSLLLTPELLDIQKLDVQWTKTDRAENLVSVTGKVAYSDLTKPSKVEIASKSIDFTPQLDWLKSSTSEETQTVENAPAEPAVATENADHSLPLPKVEPAAMDLPVKDFELKLNVGEIYLKQMSISNLLAGVNIKNNVIGLDVESSNVNGGDKGVLMNANADLGQPGYKYDLTIDAPNIPAGPIFDFAAANLPGELSKGTVYAVGNLSGMGITEASIQKNLGLGMSCGLTNVAFRPVTDTYKLVLTPVLTLLRINDIADSPIVGIACEMGNTDSVFDLRTARVITEAFEVDVNGKMNLTPVLMDTPLDLPVDIYLRSDIAKKSSLTLPNAATNSVGFEAIPSLVKLGGTPAEWKIDIDKVALARLTLQSGVGGVLNVGSDANKLLGKGANLLVGDSVGTNGVQGIVEGVGKGVVGGVGNLIGIGKKDTEDGNTNSVDGGAVGGIVKGIGGLIGVGGKKEDGNTNSVDKPSESPAKGIVKGLGGLLRNKDDKEKK